MSGYIGNVPTPQATQTRQSFTATASQTSFATAGYTAGFLDVYLNGVHLLDSADYTATNGSDIVLTVGAAAGDVLEVVSYSTFEVLDPTFTGTTTVDVLSVTGAATGTDLTLSGGVKGLFFTKAGQAGIKIGAVAVNPCDSAGADLDNYADLGATSNRWKDAYLSGGVYLGGTGAANKLDDYEEGTWSPNIADDTGVRSSHPNQGKYVKIGNMVWVSARIYGGSSFTSTGTPYIPLPFTPIGNQNQVNAGVTYTTGAANAVCVAIYDGQGYLNMSISNTNPLPNSLGNGTFMSSTKRLYFGPVVYTTA